MKAPIGFILASFAIDQNEHLMPDLICQGFEKLFTTS
jgi:hypothetical protein